MNKEINLDNLNIKIRKSTRKYHRRAKIWVVKEQAKMEITNQEWDYDCEDMAVVFNHEFLHWIISVMSKTKPKQYDRFLEVCGWYWHEILKEMWL